MVKIKILFGFQPVSAGDFIRNPALVKGKALYKSQHVRSLEETIEDGNHRITAKCLPQTNVNDKEYDIKIEVCSERNVNSATCTCKAGIIGKCKHVAAVIEAINQHDSGTKTSESRSWGIPAKRKAYSGRKISELFKPKESIQAKSMPATYVMQCYPDLDCPLVACLSATQETMERTKVRQRLEANREQQRKEEAVMIIKSIVDNAIIYVPPLVLVQAELDHQTYYMNNVFMSADRIIELAELTTAQNMSTLWYQERLLRISATKCKPIITRVKDFEKLVQNFLKKTEPLDLAKSSDPRVYGINTEPVARKAFIQHYKKKVILTGVVVSPHSHWLCASPDGIVLEDNGEFSLLEIKCPSSCKSTMLYQGTTSPLKYIEFIQDVPQLKQTHEYYAQVQLSMHGMVLQRCHFYVYSPVQQIHLVIPYDQEFVNTVVLKLMNFYFQYYLPMLYDNNPKSG